MDTSLQNGACATVPLCTCENNDLLALGASLDLSLSFQDLFLIREHYRKKEKRDPLTSELKLLQAILRSARALPQNTILYDLDCEEADRRVFADLQKKAALLGKNASELSLADLAALTANYATHCGLSPRNTALYATDAASAAVLPPCTEAPLIIGEHGALFAHRCTQKKSKHVQNLLLLLRNDGSEDFSKKVNRFLRAAEPFGVHLIKRIGAEGLPADLPLPPQGLTLDLAPVHADVDTALETLEGFGVGDVLLKAPERHLHEIVALGAPLVAIGRITTDERISVFHGRRLLFSFSTALLALLDLHRKIKPEVLHAPAVCFDALYARGLSAITLSGDCLTMLCEWLCRAVASGADLHSASLCTLLTLPDCGKETVSAILPALLAFHRMASELALPVATANVSLCQDATPKLTVFLHTEATVRTPTITEAELQTAIDKADFAHLRSLLRK